MMALATLGWTRSVRLRATALAVALLATTTLSACGKEALNLPPVVGQMPGAMPYVPNNTGGYQGGLPSAIDHGNAGPTNMVLKNVRYRVGPKLTIDVAGMDAKMIPMQQGAPIVMDDTNSFTIFIQNGAFALDEENVASLMNNYVLNYPDPQLKNLTAHMSPGRLGMKGTLHKGVDMPFEMEGPAVALPNGKILLTPDKVKAMGFSSLGLMKLAGLTMESMCKIKEGRGVSIEGNTIIMDPSKMLPPPAINGRVSQVVIEADPRDGKQKMNIVFGGGPQAVRDEKLPAPQAPNYIHLLGGPVRFVNTFSTYTNLQIVDADPNDMFDFYMPEYGVQMLNGVIVLAPTGWTLSIQPDYLKRHIPLRPNVPGVNLPASDNGGGYSGGYPGGNGSYSSSGAAVGTYAKRKS